ncbi:OGDHL, partial [Symbiodinium sp. CCMP2456]
MEVAWDSDLQDPNVLWPAENEELTEKTKRQAREAVANVLEATAAGDALAVERSVGRLAVLQESFDYCRNMLVA